VSVPAEQLACKSAASHRRCWDERRQAPQVLGGAPGARNGGGPCHGNNVKMRRQAGAQAGGSLPQTWTQVRCTNSSSSMLLLVTPIFQFFVCMGSYFFCFVGLSLHLFVVFV
jgi:hypothetical protein